MDNLRDLAGQVTEVLGKLKVETVFENFASSEPFLGYFGQVSAKVDSCRRLSSAYGIQEKIIIEETSLLAQVDDDSDQESDKASLTGKTATSKAPKSGAIGQDKDSSVVVSNSSFAASSTTTTTAAADAPSTEKFLSLQSQKGQSSHDSKTASKTKSSKSFSSSFSGLAGALNRRNETVATASKAGGDVGRGVSSEGLIDNDTSDLLRQLIPTIDR